MSARPVHGYSVSHIRSSSSSVLVVAESRVASRYKSSPPKSACSRWRAAETASAVSSQSCVGVWLAVRTTCMRTGSRSPRLLCLLASLLILYGPCTVYMLSIAHANPILCSCFRQCSVIASQGTVVSLCVFVRRHARGKTQNKGWETQHRRAPNMCARGGP